MANKFLLPVYKKVFGESFSYGRFEDRLKSHFLTAGDVQNAENGLSFAGRRSEYWPLRI